MDDPLSFIGDADLGAILAIAAGLALVCGAAFPALATPQAPRGIVSLELAARSATVRAIVGAWTLRGRLRAARRSLWLDVVFIVLYVVALSALAVLAGRAVAASGLVSAGAGETIAAVGAALAVAAGVLDLLEDAGLALELRGRDAQPLPLATAACAWTKWALLGVLLVGALDLLIAGAIAAVF
jgi:hypothetical protein